jgi:hypothetical protein
MRGKKIKYKMSEMRISSSLHLFYIISLKKKLKVVDPDGSQKTF